MRRILVLTMIFGAVFSLLLTNNVFADDACNNSDKSSAYLNLKYRATGGEIEKICVYGGGSTVISLTMHEDGELLIDIPKRFIDRTKIVNCNTVDFLVLANSEEIVFSEENKHARFHTLVIPLTMNTTEIEIVRASTPESTGKILFCLDNLPPKQQILAGRSPDTVTCKHDFILIGKTSDHSVVCVAPSTAEILIKRGWGQYLQHRDSFEVDLGNGSKFTINYEILNGMLVAISPDTNTRTIIITFESFGNGKLVIELPRAMIDARLGSDGKSGEDDSFFVLVDGTEVDFEEKANESFRELSIPFFSGSKQIEIIGTLGYP